MDFLFQPMIGALSFLNGFLGSYGLAIIVFTVLMRLVLWPLNSKQTESMKAMQAMQPKLKEIQDKYKDDPAAMQKEVMAFYSTNKFNPLAGCLPMLLQIPIFIALYGALSSPAFMQLAGAEHFGFVEHLHHTWRSNGGDPLDGTLAVDSSSRNFEAGKDIDVYLKGVAEPEKFPVNSLRMNDLKKLYTAEPQPPIAGKPLRFTLHQSDLGFDDTYVHNIVKITGSVINPSSKEVENLSFVPAKDGKDFSTEIPTKKTETIYHFGVLGLIVIYGILSWAYQWSMTLMSGTPAPTEGPQALMNKFMPILFSVLMLIIQIPAGVMLYLVTTMVMMLVQNLYLYKKDQNTPSTGDPKLQVVTVNK
jgi:YidC/Oxa1 family membrane protein insertase